MAAIRIGARREEKLLVTTDVAISFLGHDDARVLSTPHMIGFMEYTCRNLLASDFLEPGYDSVGTHVDVRHLAAAPIGESVTFTAEILSANDRRVNFRVEARTDTETIGDGTHERAIVNVEKFAARMAAKKA
jgi:fluoroacetyl-CoA thioesterase